MLQWVGEGVSAAVIEGRLVLVRLICKDDGDATRALFSPCVAFRVAGTQGELRDASDVVSTLRVLLSVFCLIYKNILLSHM